jgi:hypothetical protein
MATDDNSSSTDPTPGVGAVEESAGTSENGTSLPVALPITPTSTDAETLKAVSDYYSATLLKSAAALEYLTKRKFDDPDLIDHFHLGFSDRSLGLQLPDKTRKAGAAIRERLTFLGILKPNGRELLRGSLVVPVFDESGQIVQMFGHKVRNDLRKGTPTVVWLPGPRAGLWNVQTLAESKFVILCQDPLAGLTAWAKGDRNVVSILGLDAPTDDLAVTFEKHGVTEVAIAFEDTDAGNTKAAALAEKLKVQGDQCVHVTEPHKSATISTAHPTISIIETVAPATELVASPPSQPPTPQPPAVPTPSAIPALSTAAAQPPHLEEQGQLDEVVIAIGDRKYRARGLSRNTTFAVLKVNVLVTRTTETGSLFHTDTFDLLVARQRAAFTRAASIELGLKEEVVKKDVGTVLLRLEEEQEKLIRKALAPAPPSYTMTEADTAAALELLRSPNLIERTQQDFERCGLIGEKNNALLGYLAVLSRKLDQPLALLIRSSSAAGKSALMEALLDFTPEEDRQRYSAMTAQSLFYLGETGLRHKVLAVSEDQGTERIAYPLKLLLSDGELSIASTGKDTTGKLIAETYKVRGPVSLMLTSTAADIDEELTNRCLTLTVNEDPAQTRAIHQLQRERETLEGLLARKGRERVRKLHQDAQRLIRPLAVLNPHVKELRFPDAQTRMRRDFLKYIAVVKTIALLHQQQREVKTATVDGETIEYIEVVPSDISLANQLCRPVFGQSLDDLAPQARRLLHLLDRMVTEACAKQGIDRTDLRFHRRDIRAFTGWSDFQVRVHLKRLIELEAVLVHQGGRGRLFEYQLLFDGKTDNGVWALGLLDPETVQAAGTTGGPTPTARGPEATSSPLRAPPCAGFEPPVSPSGNGTSPKAPEGLASTSSPEPGIARPGGIRTNGSSYSYTQPAEDIASAIHAATEKS